MAVYTTASHTWAVGETVTAANMNSQIRDFINGFGAWTSFTPSWSSSGTAPVLGNGTLSGAYSQVGKLVLWSLTFVAGSTTTFGTGNYAFGVPVTMQTIGDGGPVGSVSIVDSSAGARYLGDAIYTGTNFNVNVLTQPAAGASALVGATSPMTWAVGDKLSIGGSYQSV